jgi:hypothetical protein
MTFLNKNEMWYNAELNVQYVERERERVEE